MNLRRIQTVGQTAFRVYCNIVQNSQDLPALSNRELEVLYWIGRGKSNSVIAEILAISPSSVDVYVRRIFAKLDVTDRTTASIKAITQGLLVSGDYERFVAEQRKQQYGEE
jgi:LuxR family quorum-sensing system transcriptional regulator CciR